ncbi:hypothetical protein PFISCL1PPCAC_7508, partial [Pristionchus fissidentatus]
MMTSTGSTGPTTQFLSRFAEEYQDVKVIGKGRDGQAFEVLSKLAKKKYAVERIELRDGPNEDKLREVRALAHFDHPHVVRYSGSWIEQPPSIWQVKLLIIQSAISLALYAVQGERSRLLQVRSRGS